MEKKVKGEVRCEYVTRDVDGKHGFNIIHVSSGMPLGGTVGWTDTKEEATQLWRESMQKLGTKVLGISGTVDMLTDDGCQLSFEGPMDKMAAVAGLNKSLIADAAKSTVNLVLAKKKNAEKYALIVFEGANTVADLDKWFDSEAEAYAYYGDHLDEYAAAAAAAGCNIPLGVPEGMQIIIDQYKAKAFTEALEKINPGTKSMFSPGDDPTAN